MANNAYGGVPRHDDNINKLEGVSIHDAIPRQYFMQTWAKVFVRLLGTKTQDGFTFLQVYNMTDMGGVNWVGGALNADQTRQHVQRKARLLAMLKGVIDYTSTHYAELDNFAGEGPSACLWYFNEMHLPTPAHILSLLDSLWITMNVLKLNLLIEPLMPAKWAKIVLQIKDYFDVPKTLAQCRLKFLEGL